MTMARRSSRKPPSQAREHLFKLIPVDGPPELVVASSAYPREGGILELWVYHGDKRYLRFLMPGVYSQIIELPVEEIPDEALNEQPDERPVESVEDTPKDSRGRNKITDRYFPDAE
jgi:hypothetical protein